jgi:hypothetical protein
MNATMITCPNCGTEIPLSEALQEQFRHENEGRLAVLAGQAQQKARPDFALEKELLEGQLAEERQKREEAQRAELVAQGKERCRGSRPRARSRSGAPRRRREATAGRAAGSEAQGKGQADRRSAQVARRGQAQERAGLAGAAGRGLEVDVQAELERRFPHDVIVPVAKGMRGADLIQEVRDLGSRVCGTIVWETKNTRHWHQGWLDKVKEDQRAIGANLAVIVSTALPDGVAEFGRFDGVWVAGLRAWPALAVALREQPIQVAFAHAAAEGKHEKMEFLYRYLAGDQFRRRIEATVEAFTALRNGLTRERNAMERIWNEREKQIDRVLANTAGMYGEVRGILGTSVRPVPALELDAVAGRFEDAAAEVAG